MSLPPEVIENGIGNDVCNTLHIAILLMLSLLYLISPAIVLADV